MAVVGVGVAVVGVGGWYAKSPKQKRPIFQTKGYRGQENMGPGDQEAMCSRLQQGLIFKFQDFLKSGHQEIRRS